MFAHKQMVELVWWSFASNKLQTHKDIELCVCKYYRLLRLFSLQASQVTLLQVRKQKHSYFLESFNFSSGYSLILKWLLFFECFSCVVLIGEAYRCVHEWNGPLACLIPLRWTFQTFFSISVPKIIKTCSAHHLNWISRAGRSSWDRHWSESPHR